MIKTYLDLHNYIYFIYYCIYVLGCWVLRLTNTLKVIWRLSNFTGGGRPRVPLRALFQARVNALLEEE